ncbi:MAG: endolytic transglycosylase MltG [Candidatus Dormibacteria bacterium]
MRGARGRIIVVVLLVALVLLGAAGGGALLFGRPQLEPVSNNHANIVAVTVTAGEGLDAVSSDLSAKGLLRSKFWFTLFARFKGLGDHLQPGMFKLDSGMGASAIIAKLEGPADVPPRRLLLAEGLTADQMASKVDAAQLGVTREQYLQALQRDHFNAPFLSMRPAGVTSLEGFLFPDSYTVPMGATAHDIVQMQLDDFSQRVLPALSPSNPYGSLVIASILEREAKFADDRPLVAAVINNRLARGMRLQVDATVVYGLNKVGEAMSVSDRQVDTAYNSYLHAGLPPTPISNPGLANVQPAVAPARTDDLFYVSDTCGHNHYARTGADFEALKQKYLGTPCPP